MGDIVQSEKSHAPEELHAAFNRAVDHQNKVHADRLASPLTITLGDEFQGIVTAPVQALPIIRDLRLQLMSSRIQCRFVIGDAELKTEINRSVAWNMMGPGLARARAKLNEKKDTTLYRFSLKNSPLLETLLDALGAGITAIERGWTDRQREDIAALMSGLGPAELARRRNVSVHSIYKVRAAGSFVAYAMQWRALEEALTATDCATGPT